MSEKDYYYLYQKYKNKYINLKGGGKRGRDENETSSSNVRSRPSNENRSAAGAEQNTPAAGAEQNRLAAGEEQINPDAGINDMGDQNMINQYENQIERIIERIINFSINSILLDLENKYNININDDIRTNVREIETNYHRNMFGIRHERWTHELYRSIKEIMRNRDDALRRLGLTNRPNTQISRNDNNDLRRQISNIMSRNIDISNRRNALLDLGLNDNDIDNLRLIQTRIISDIKDQPDLLDQLRAANRSKKSF